MPPLKILLFSSDTPFASSISKCLSKAEYMVAYLPDGLGALERIQSEKPCLVILDVNLPGIKSLAIIRSIRAEEYNSRLPIILTGTNMREEDVLIGLEVGADLCLVEMFNPQVFIARVRSLLRRSETVKALKT